jgi:hypothetical protein
MSSFSGSPLSRALSNASVVPSGENAGAESKTALSVSCTMFVPAASITYSSSSPLWSTASVSPRNTIFEPSGE